MQIDETTDETAERSDALVMFGLTGDLGENKLFPAIADLIEAGRAPRTILGVGRSDYSDDDLATMFVEAVGEDKRHLLDDIDLRYISGDSTEAETYDAIADALGDATCPVVYTALPPELFATVAEQLDASSLPDTTRLVVEKPFGNDVESAQDLHDAITEKLPVDQLFMVDHFLAKTSIENLMSFRRFNPMIDAAMRAGTVSRIEFTMAEAFDVDGRGSFYDSVGAIKDVLQNHILQTIAVLLMEPPVDESGEAFDTARAELLGAIVPIEPDDAVLGQYDGYLDTEDVPADSRTETFVACRLRVENPRWEGVDVLVRTGKAMTDTYTEAVVVFSDGNDDVPPNRLRLGLKPKQCFEVEIAVLGDHDHHSLSPGLLSSTALPGNPVLGDYATMLDGAMSGDHRHFARIADTLAAWGIVAPLLSIDAAPERYERQSTGPATADGLVPSGEWIEFAR